MINFYCIRISSNAILFCKIYISPTYLAFNNCYEVRPVIAVLIYPNCLFPLNLGPIEGRLGREVSLTYLWIFN